jgi:hypothetical protein
MPYKVSKYLTSFLTKLLTFIYDSFAGARRRSRGIQIENLQ